MAYRITDSCISCGICMGFCRFDAIVERPHGFEIDPAVCVSCGCCAEECPVWAIEEFFGDFRPSSVPDVSPSEQAGFNPCCDTTERIPEDF